MHVCVRACVCDSLSVCVSVVALPVDLVQSLYTDILEDMPVMSHAIALLHKHSSKACCAYQRTKAKDSQSQGGQVLSNAPTH